MEAGIHDSLFRVLRWNWGQSSFQDDVAIALIKGGICCRHLAGTSRSRNSNRQIRCICLARTTMIGYPGTCKAVHHPSSGSLVSTSTPSSVMST